MKILVYRIGSIGDTIVALPALWHIRLKYPDAKITILTNTPRSKEGKAISLKKILEGSSIANEYIEYSAGGFLWNVLEIQRRIRNLKPNLFIYLMPTRNLKQLIRDFLFFKIIGVKKIIGLFFSKGYQTRIQDLDSGLWEHESHRLCRLISCQGDVDYNSAKSWSLELSFDENRLAEVMLESLMGMPFISLSIGTKVDTKDWGIQNWIELVGRLAIKYPTYALVMVGSSDEYSQSEQVALHWRSPALNLCGKVGPRVSAAILNRATIFIGHDSGPMHLAASVETPIVAIFSAQNKPGEWYPWGVNNKVIYHKTNCFGCQLSTCRVEKKKCIYSIKVDEVMDSIDEIHKKLK